MGKIEGIKIQNYGVLKDIVLGKTRTNQNAKALGNLVAVIGPSGTGKSTLADAFGFIADCLEMGVEAACDANNRAGGHIAHGCDLKIIDGKCICRSILDHIGRAQDSEDHENRHFTD